MNDKLEAFYLLYRSLCVILLIALCVLFITL